MSSFLPTAPDRSKPKLLDQVRQLMRLRHYSLRTEEAYIGWIRRYILFHGKRHPRELDEKHVSQFLTSLAINGRVAAATQNQALNALLFLYKEVLRHELGFVANALRVKRPPKMPVVLSPNEVRAVLCHLDGQYRLMAQLLYGSGLRLLECLRLRVKDVDLHYLHITVRDPKGGRERKTMVPVSLAVPVREHLDKVKRVHEQDLAEGFGSVYLPTALERKIPNASREWVWQYVFPAERRSIDPRTGIERWHHANEKNLQNAVKAAVRKSGVSKRASCHTLRHSFRHAFAREWVRHPNRAGTPWSQRSEHDDDLHACAQQAGPRREEPARLKVRDREDARWPACVTRALPEPHSASQLRPHGDACGSLEFAPTDPGTFERA